MNGPSEETETKDIGLTDALTDLQPMSGPSSDVKDRDT